MAKDKQQPVDEGPPGPGDWIVTFSDCMTLLLCFFVLLLTFSSFDEDALKRFGGAFAYDQIRPGIIERPRPKGATVEPIPNINDQTREGSETPSKTEKTKENWDRPHDPSSPENAVYLDRKIIHIPSRKLFENGSSDLSKEGKRLLDVVREFLTQMTSCRIVISENTPRRTLPNGVVVGRRGGLSRVWTIVNFLTSDRTVKDDNDKETVIRGIARDRFNVSTGQLAPMLTGEGGVVEIAMLSGKGQT